MKRSCGCHDGGNIQIQCEKHHFESKLEVLDELRRGAKHDEGKPPMALLPRVALEAVAQVLAHGAEKYGPDNWRGGIGHRRLLSAALRHIFAFADGEDNDAESGLSHLAHAGCCILFLLEEHARKPQLDDRYSGKAAEGDQEITVRLYPRIVVGGESER